MDSLVARYASSEEEEDEERKVTGRENRNSLSSLPVDLPKPSNQSENPRKIFDFSSSLPKPKRIVHLTLPANPYLFKTHDDDDDDDDEEDKEASKTRAKTPEGSKPFGSNLKSLSSILPPPKNSLCLSLPTSSIYSRRSTVESVAPVDIATNICQDPVNISNPEVEVAGKASEYPIQNGETTNYADYGNLQDQWVDESSATASESAWGSDNYANYGDYTNYNSDYLQRPGAVEQEAPAIVENLGRIGGKRRRNEIPLNIVEVKQDELMKNRPREDQSKLTGIAFGPSYQPAPSSKGKPSKLHKRKHQIGSLYHDMKQKEMELNERRARGFLTKAETHAKYGW